MKDYKYYASACSSSHGNFLEPLGFSSTNNIEEADVIIFGGGADVDPKNYGEEKGSRTYANPKRDKEEIRDFKFAQKVGIPSLGICRGHQFLCAMVGGKLIQDVSNHAGSDHQISTFDGLTLTTNSLHHQMINPYILKPKEYKILAWTPKRLSNRYFGAKDKSVYLPYEFKEIEAIYFPTIRAFSVQFHPEMMFNRSGKNEAVVTWTQKTFLQFFENKL
jgi:putative glutamine amidotransferase